MIIYYTHGVGSTPRDAVPLEGPLESTPQSSQLLQISQELLEYLFIEIISLIVSFKRLNNVFQS